MNLMKIAHVPPVVVGLDAMVSDAVHLMVENAVGAVAVVDSQGLLKGIFSERDVLRKVVHYNMRPEMTRVAEVMTGSVESIDADTAPEDALRTMVDRHFRHLPIVDGRGHVQGILSIRNILQNRVEELEDSISSITSYYAADGPGG